MLSVIVGHADLSACEPRLPAVITTAALAAARFVSGVELFFVLSGFLVSGLLFREYQRNNTVDASRFLVRRGLKIYPSFYVFLLASIAISLSCGIWPNATPATIVSEALFVQNYARPLWPHTWSLAVEEHFYLALVAVLVWMTRSRDGRRIRLIPVIAATVAILCLAGRCLTAWAMPEFSFHYHLAPSHLRFDSFAFGLLLSYWYHFYPELLYAAVRRWWTVLAIVAIAILVPCTFIARHTLFGHTFLQSFQYVSHGIVLLLAIFLPSLETLYGSFAGRAVQAIGRYSYSIYLWHMGVLVWSSELLQWQRFLQDDADNALLHLAVYAALVVPVGVAAAMLVEMPIIAIRDRLYPSKAAGMHATFAAAATSDKALPFEGKAAC